MDVTFLVDPGMHGIEGQKVLMRRIDVDEARMLMCISKVCILVCISKMCILVCI